MYVLNIALKALQYSPAMLVTEHMHGLVVQSSRVSACMALHCTAHLSTPIIWGMPYGMLTHAACLCTNTCMPPAADSNP